LRPVLDFDYALAFSWTLNGAPGHEPKATISSKQVLFVDGFAQNKLASIRFLIDGAKTNPH